MLFCPTLSSDRSRGVHSKFKNENFRMVIPSQMAGICDLFGRPCAQLNHNINIGDRRFSTRTLALAITVALFAVWLSACGGGHDDGGGGGG